MITCTKAEEELKLKNNYQDIDGCFRSKDEAHQNGNEEGPDDGHRKRRDPSY